MTKTALQAPSEPAEPLAGQARPHIQRHRGDLARLVFALGLGVAGTLVLAVDRRTADGISLDILALVDWVPVGVAQAIVGTIQLLAIFVPIAVVAVLLWRRAFRALAVAAAAGTVGGGVMAILNHVVEVGVPAEVAERAREVSFVTGAAFPSAPYWAATVAVVVGLAPWTTRAWRRAAWVFRWAVRTTTGDDHRCAFCAFAPVTSPLLSQAQSLIRLSGCPNERGPP